MSLSSRALQTSLWVASLILLGCAGDGGTRNVEPPRSITPGAKKYFYFSSDDSATKVLLTEKGKEALAGSSVIAGIDPGGDVQSATFQKSVQDMKDAGWSVHVYLEGPGGPTDGKWDPEECVRIHRAAESLGEQGIPADDECKKDAEPWMVRWNGTRFLTYLEGQLARMAQLALPVDSVEVDNLARGGYGAGQQKPLADFVSWFAAARGRAKSNARLLLKNIETTAELDTTVEGTRREMVADFMIVEEYIENENKGRWCDLVLAARKHGIATALSWDTNHFHAETDDLGKDLVLAGPEQAKRKAWACPA